MGQGLGLALAYGAKAASDTLEDIIRQKRQDQADRQVLRERQEAKDFQRSQAAERSRQWEASHNRLIAGDKVAAGEREAAALARKQRTDLLARLTTEPDILKGLSPRQRLALYAQAGVTNVNLHDVEEGPDHAAHVAAENQVKLDDFKERQNITHGFRMTEQAARDARTGARADSQRVGRLRVDNPQQPAGAERYIVSLATKHGGKFDDAARELDAYLQGSGIEAHPNMSASWAQDVLRKSFARPTGATSYRPASGGTVQGSTPEPTIFTPAAGGRGSGPAPQLHRWPDGTTRAYPPGSDAQPPKSSTVKMRAPNGAVSDIPADQVDHYMSLGARIVTGKK